MSNFSSVLLNKCSLLIKSLLKLNDLILHCFRHNFIVPIISYCVFPHCFRTLLYYLDLLYTNMCPIEIPAKGQLREVKIYVDV